MNEKEKKENILIGFVLTILIYILRVCVHSF